jgi:hypothetical protein
MKKIIHQPADARVRHNDVQLDSEGSSNTTMSKRKQRRRPKKKKVVPVLDRKYGVWVPKRCLVMDSTHHTRKMRLAQRAERIESLFKGSRNKFSLRAKHTITASTIAAVGASYFGVQSVIFGTLKALLDEMGFDCKRRREDDEKA